MQFFSAYFINSRLREWTTKNIDEIVNKVVTQAEENDIILLHDCYES